MDEVQRLRKSACMCMVSHTTLTSLQAVVELLEKLLNNYELPYESTHSELAAGFLLASKFWCGFEGGGMQYFGAEAAKRIFAQLAAVEDLPVFVFVFVFV